MFYLKFLEWCEVTREHGTEIVTDVTGDIYHSCIVYFIIKRFQWAQKILNQ